MRVKDAIILGIITIVGSGFMFSYFSGFDPSFVKGAVIISSATIILFLIAAYKKGLFKRSNE